MVTIQTAALPNKTVWEEVAETRWGSYTTKIERRWVTFAGSMPNTARRALEVGCEGGRWSKLLSNLGWRMICADVDESALRVCQAKVPESICLLTSPEATSLPCKATSVQLILCIEVVPVIHSDWFAAEANRILQPGGLVVGVMWNNKSLRALFCRATRRKRCGYYYRQSYRRWRKKFRRQGFEFIKEEGFCWCPFERASNSKLIPLFTALEWFLGLRKLPSVSPWIVFVARKVGQSSVPIEELTQSSPLGGREETAAPNTMAGRVSDGPEVHNRSGQSLII